jgi:hypothetical protein
VRSAARPASDSLLPVLLYPHARVATPLPPAIVAHGLQQRLTTRCVAAHPTAIVAVRDDDNAVRWMGAWHAGSRAAAVRMHGPSLSPRPQRSCWNG